MMYYSSKPVLYVLPLHLPLGVLLWGGGLGLVLWSRKAVKHLANREVLFRLAQEHTAKGPYQYMQHPMYIGITFALLGSALLLDNYMAAALVLVGMVPLFMLRAYIESH
jgi:protein-S-isoprenylcysteine O-methyltransferase Ste14